MLNLGGGGQRGEADWCWFDPPVSRRRERARLASSCLPFSGMPATGEGIKKRQPQHAAAGDENSPLNRSEIGKNKTIDDNVYDGRGVRRQQGQGRSLSRGQEIHGDSYVPPLDDLKDILLAINLIQFGSAIRSPWPKSPKVLTESIASCWPPEHPSGCGTSPASRASRIISPRYSTGGQASSNRTSTAGSITPGAVLDLGCIRWWQRCRSRR